MVALMMLFQGVADLLQDSPLEIRVLQQIGDGEL